jgi:hypothetical protein
MVYNILGNSSEHSSVADQPHSRFFCISGADDTPNDAFDPSHSHSTDMTTPPSPDESPSAIHQELNMRVMMWLTFVLGSANAADAVEITCVGEEPALVL